jgi:Ohr subfamily peroxiredoxin
MSAMYTTHVEVRGGRAGHARSSDGRLDLALDMPEEMGGAGRGTNPEQLFGAAYASCFASAIEYEAGRAGAEAGEITIDARVELIHAKGGRFHLAVGLDVTAGGITDAATAAEVGAAAHRACPFSNATKGNIAFELTVNGARIEGGDDG